MSKSWDHVWRTDRRRHETGTCAEPQPERRNEPPREISFSTCLEGSELTISVLSILTAQTVEHARGVFWAAVAEYAGAKTVLLDMQRCAFVDSAGLGLLSAFREELAAGGKLLVLQNPDATVTRILNLTFMARLFQIRHTNTDHELISSSRWNVVAISNGGASKPIEQR